MTLPQTIATSVAIAATGLSAIKTSLAGGWIHYTLAGKGYKKISFISANQCCSAALLHDMDRNTVFAQEYRCALQRGFDESVCPRSLFAEEITQYVSA